MRYIIVAPACNVPLPDTDPRPNRLILDRAIELATELAIEYPVTIFTDGYIRQPARLPNGVAFVRGEPAPATSQVIFLRQLEQYLRDLKDDYTLIAVITPHYCRRWRRDVPKILERTIPIDDELSGMPKSAFFSEDGADWRSRSFAIWLVRELMIEAICFISWRLYAKLTG